MCMIDNAEGSWARFDSGLRTARKRHQCCECHRSIEPGEQYEYASGLDTYDVCGWVHFKTCRHCIAAREWLTKVCGGWLYEGVLEDLDEHRIETQYNPRWLNIAVSGMRNRWRNKDGSMRRPMSLPKRLPIPEHAH